MYMLLMLLLASVAVRKWNQAESENLATKRNPTMFVVSKMLFVFISEFFVVSICCSCWLASSGWPAVCAQPPSFPRPFCGQHKTTTTSSASGAHHARKDTILVEVGKSVNILIRESSV
jgi:hypothetical protein